MKQITLLRSALFLFFALSVYATSHSQQYRYVRIQKSGSNPGGDHMNLAEIEAIDIDGATNRAVGGTATLSSTGFGGVASRGNDGNTNGLYSNNSVFHSNAAGTNDWWEVDLGAQYTLSQINIYNRTDCCSDRLSNVYVLLSNIPFDTSGSDNANLTTALSQATFTYQLGNTMNALEVVTLPVTSCTGSTISSFPYSESFESGVGDWTQNAGDDGNWTLRSGRTPTGNNVNFETGPFQASESTFYFYTESSTGTNPGPNATTILTSPCLDLTSLSEAYFSFDYHMAGTAIGSLDVEISDNAGGPWTNIFNQTGQAQTQERHPWRKEIIDLSAYVGTTVNIRFVGNTGANFRSDIAIDNINVTENPQYCGAMGIYNNSTIRRVAFNTIDNSSPIEEIGYTDYTNLSTDVTQGDTHDLTVQINTNGNFFFGVYAWIDWNQDQFFNNASERYDLGTATNVTNNPTSNSPLSITIPNGAAIGQTRMRIISRYNAYPTSSCDEDNNFFGEVEDYTINVISGTPQPEMDIAGLGNSIPDGDTTPNLSDDTDFGSVIVGNSNPNTFTIINTGNLDLNLTGGAPYVTLSGSTNFTLTAIPASNISDSGGTTTFQITYTPTVTGVETATVSIANDDANENPYNFTIRGEGVGPEPEMGVTGQGNNILDGDTTPTTVDGTDFGNVLTGSNTFQDFIINNTGSTDLVLTSGSPYVTITGPGAGEFTLTTAPTSPIPSSGGTSTFRITYNPTSTGTHNATLTIANNDSNENPYKFDITGFSNTTLTPEIDIIGSGNSIVNGDTTPSVLDNTNFGVTEVGNSNINDFTINNVGNGLLTLTGGSPYITITGADAAQFSINSIPANTIVAGGSTSFQINYTPTAAGVHDAVISIANDDSNEDPYNYNIQGTAVVDINPDLTIYYENFDNNNGGWTASNPGGNSVWTYGVNAIEPGTEGNYWYTSNYDDYASNSDTYVTSPIIDLTGYNNVQLRLDIRYNTDNDTDDGMNVEYSSDGGTTWQILGAYAATPIDNWYNTDDVSALGAGADGWAGLNREGAGGGRSNFVRAIISTPPILDNNPLARLRVHFASDNAVVDNGVNLDNVLLLGDSIVPIGDPSSGPADVSTNLKLWLKTNVGTNGVTDGSNINRWSDQAMDNHSEAANNPAPVYYNNSTENINHNPVLYFNDVDDNELKGKGGYYTDEYWVVIQPDASINSTTPLEGIVSGRINNDQFGEDGTGLWINPGSIRFQGVDNIVSHMVGSTPANTTSGSPESYGRAYVSSTDSYDNEVIILNVKYDALTNESAIFKNGIQIDNDTGNAFNQGTGTVGGLLDYDKVDNSNYAIGVGRITIAGTPYDSHFNGKMTEFISYSVPNSLLDQQKIQSYLAIKNGVTLHSINSTTVTREGDENYIDSDGNVIWDTVANTGFNYDIAGIGRDEDSELNQKQSTSSNPSTVITMGLTDVYATNSQNIAANPNVIPNQNFLMWGNDNRPFAASTPISVDISSGISGLSTMVDFTAIQRTWKVVETGSVGDVKISIPEVVLAATLTPPGDYLMFVSDTPSFSPTSEYRVMSHNGANLEALYDFDGTKYVTFGYAPEYYYERSITFDGTQDYLDAGNVLDRTGAFTISAWIKRIDRDYSIISKRDAAFSEGYDITLLNNRRLEMSWINGSGTQDIQTSVQIPENEWHQFAFTYDGSSEARVYIDGVLDNTETLSPPVVTEQSFLIGAADGSAPADFYEGTIDEVRVWDIALTEDQVRFIMNQEIEQNGDLTVAGKIVPTTISKNEFSTTTWSSLAGYFPMNRYTFTNVKDESDSGLVAAIKNLETVDFQTAPLPYVSASNGAWTNSSAWTNGATQELPCAQSISDNSLTIDWNIVQTAHNITTNANNTVLSLDIQSAELTIDNDSKIEVSHYLKLDGVMDLVGESQLIQTENSDLDTNSSGNLERDQQGTADTFSYNGWSAPVSSINTSINNQNFTVSSLMLDGTNANNPVSMLFSGGFNGAATTPITISAYWLWKYANNPANTYADWQYVGHSGSVSVGEGYTIKGPGTGAITDPQNYTFKGKPNNSTDADEINLNITAGNQYFVGNPFPSALDADDFIMDNPHLDGTLYFWEHWGGGTHVLSGYQAGYATYTLGGGVPAASHPSVDQTGSGTKTPGRYIPVGQGFFTEATTTGTIVFNNTQRNFVRETSGSSFFFFNGNANADQNDDANNEEQSPDDSYFDAPDTRQKFRLEFNSPQQYKREILLTEDENTTLGYDRMYDGLNNGGPDDDMKWMIDEDEAVIQVIPKITDITVLPLQLKVTTEGTTTINLTDIENENLNIDIFIKDALTNTRVNLKEEVFVANLTPGVHQGRFFVVFKETQSNTTSSDSDQDQDQGQGQDQTSNNDQNGSGNSDDTTTTDQNLVVSEITTTDVVELDLTINYVKNSNAIIISKDQNYSITNATLYSMLGQVIQEWSPNTDAQEIALPVNGISTGAYLIYLQTQTGVVTKKLIIH